LYVILKRNIYILNFILQKYDLKLKTKTFTKLSIKETNLCTRH